MLSRAFEWYRIADVNPSSQTIDNRIAAARDIVTAIDDAKDWDLALGCVVGVVAGFNHDSPVVNSLVDAIHAHESAFPRDLTENALALRACTGIALGEILVRNGDKPPDRDALFIASVVRSGLTIRPSAKGKHLIRFLEEFQVAAAKTLSTGGVARRQQLGKLEQRFKSLKEPADLSAAWKSLLPVLEEAMKEITQQSTIDREELDVLWWMFAGRSTTTGQPISEIPAGAAAICCGAELGDKCLVPPLASLEAMVQRAYEAGRRPQDNIERNIEKLAADWDAQLPNTLARDENVRILARTFPSLFPLSWLCDRLMASKGATSWAAEFERMTGIPSKHARLPTEWATQAFRERVAHRMHADFSE